MPDKNIGLTVDAEIAELIVAAWLEPLAKLNLTNSIRARAFLSSLVEFHQENGVPVMRTRRW